MYFTSDPDRWYPSSHEQRRTQDTCRLQRDVLVVWQRKAHRVVEVRDRAQHDWHEKWVRLWKEHGMPDPQEWGYRPQAIVLRLEDQPTAKEVHLEGPANASWYVLPEHYSICRICHEIPPCGHVHNERIAERVAEKFAKDMAILPGTCHGCRGPITRRQKHFTFPGPNLIRPDLGDNSAVFHTRESCSDALHAYDMRWSRAEPGRASLFHCPGTVIHHHGGTLECDWPDCLAKGEHAKLVSHKARIWHHPEADPTGRACWCLTEATLPGM